MTNSEIITQYESKVDRKDVDSFQNFLLGYMAGFLTEEQIHEAAKAAYIFALRDAIKRSKEMKEGERHTRANAIS